MCQYWPVEFVCVQAWLSVALFLYATSHTRHSYFWFCFPMTEMVSVRYIFYLLGCMNYIKPCISWTFPCIFCYLPVLQLPCPFYPTQLANSLLSTFMCLPPSEITGKGKLTILVMEVGLVWLLGHSWLPFILLRMT